MAEAGGQARRAVLLGLIALGSAGTVADLSTADGHLARGRWRLAAQAYEGVLLDRPKSPRARIGLGRALAALGECEEALDMLDSARDSFAWRVSASLAEGRCLEQLGQLAAAVEVYDHATWRAPDHPEAWVALARARAARGEAAGTEAALDAMRGQPGGWEAELVVRAEWALRRADPAFDDWLGLAARALGPSPVLALLDARAWMDHGDPRRAQRVLLDQLRQTPDQAQLVLWRAEALRRLGEADETLALHDAEILEPLAGSPLARALRARALVDAARLEEAERLLAGLADPVTPEALASRWYLARARGDLGEAERLSTLWRRCEPSAWRALHQLVPWTHPTIEERP